MKKIQVFDPALCCSSGVCGVDVDQALVGFSADVDWALGRGAEIERFNLAQQPMAFADNAAVKAALEQQGNDALPLILVDGRAVLAGRYPTRDELTSWLGLAAAQVPPSFSAAVAEPVATAAMGPATRCCGPAPATASAGSSSCGPAAATSATAAEGSSKCC